MSGGPRPLVARDYPSLFDPRLGDAAGGRNIVFTPPVVGERFERKFPDSARVPLSHLDDESDEEDFGASFRGFQSAARSSRRPGDSFASSVGSMKLVGRRVMAGAPIAESPGEWSSQESCTRTPP